MSMHPSLSRWLRLMTLALISGAGSVFAGLSSLSISSWNVHSGEGNHQLFSKLTSSTYYSLFTLPVSVDIPFVLSSRFVGGTLTDQRFALSDFSFYVGKQFNRVEPRVGLSVPMFYSTRGAWIGSNNMKLRLGAGYRPVNGHQEDNRISGEFMFSMSLNNAGGLLRAPSSDMYLSVKGGKVLNDKLGIGAEVLATGKYAVWDRWKTTYDYGNVQEFGGGLFPALFAEFRISSPWYVSCKAGGGPGYNISSAENPLRNAHGRWVWSSNVSGSVNHYF